MSASTLTIVGITSKGSWGGYSKNIEMYGTHSDTYY